MNIYHYNIAENFYHQEEDCGSLTSPPDELLDCGDINSDIDEEVKPIEPSNLFYSKINSNPPGIFKIKGKVQVKYIPFEFEKHEDLNTDEIMFSGIVLTWIGFGTVFELDNGTERIVSPYLSKGTVR
jgi:hypothetical protein